jgi:hypothetical protein
MKSTFLIAGVSILVSVVARAQTAKVSDADVKKLADAYVAMVDPKARDDVKKKDAARKQFLAEFERIDKLVKPASLLAMPDVWAEVFYAKRVQNLPKAPSGLGRVEEKKIATSFSGKPIEFSYGLLLPNGFDVKKRYPLIIALHDKSSARDSDVNGPKYLNEVWLKLPKEERDQFIIVAPTMGPGSAGREVRVEWGDILHVRSVAEPLKKMLDEYPVDYDRVYIEGTGEGGEFAMHFALLKPQVWAAVAVRSALPRQPMLLKNGGSLPLALHYRKGSPTETNQVRQIVEHQKTTLGLPIEMKEHPASDKPVKAFASDPILEATPEIATFLASKRRNVVPKRLEFVTYEPLFRECYWARLVKFEADKDNMTELSAEVNANTIDIKTKGIEDLKIYLNDRVVNLDQPVKITVNGQPHTEKQFTRSLDALMKYFDENPLEPGIQPTAFVEIHVPVALESQPATESRAAQPEKPK